MASASAKTTDWVCATWLIVVTLLIGNGKAVINSNSSNLVSLLLTRAGGQGDTKTVEREVPLNDQNVNLTGGATMSMSDGGKVRTGSGKRSAYYYPGPGSGYGAQSQAQAQYGQTYPPQDQPFCYDRDVSGSCRYRMDPYDCDQYKWTAYATIQNIGGIQQLRSIPEGLYIPPEYQQGTRIHLRVYLTVTCCIPIVQFLSVNPYHANTGTACIVDVRQLQGLNSAEIAGVVIGVVSLLIIIVVVIGFLIRRRRSSSSLFVRHPTPLPTPRAAREREREVLPAE